MRILGLVMCFALMLWIMNMAGHRCIHRPDHYQSSLAENRLRDR